MATAPVLLWFLLVGARNTGCAGEYRELSGYLGVLWYFFSTRIRRKRISLPSVPRCFMLT